MFRDKTIAVVIPAYNEEASIGRVVAGLQALRADGRPIVDHVVVCNNASTDQTASVARDAGAMVVFEAQPGYGAACARALAALPRCDAVCFVDGDHSVVLDALPTLLDRWHDGADLVIGSRTLGAAPAGALTPQQRWGNRLAGWLLVKLWGQEVTDLGPFRVMDRRALECVQMADRRFGWTVEMQCKAIMLGMRVAEVPVDSLVRVGRSKISGTLRGTVGASWGILSTIYRCWRAHRAAEGQLDRRCASVPSLSPVTERLAR